MAVILSQPLPIIAFSKNPIWLKLMSADYLSAVQAYSVQYLEFTAAVTAGTVYLLSWTNGAATMTAAAAPDQSGNQFPAGDGSAAYVTSLLDYFTGNYALDAAYKIAVDLTHVHPRLVFTARVMDTTFDMTGTQTVITTNGNSGLIKANFRHHVEVWVAKADGSGYQKAYDANVSLDEPLTGLTTIDISQALHSYLTLDIPNLSGPIFQPAPGSCRNYFVKYAQIYGSDPVIQRVYKTVTSVVVYGGYSNQALLQIADISTYLQKYLLPNARLYTFQRWLEPWPQGSLAVRTNQPLFLSFVNSRAVTETYQLKLDLTFSDGSLQTVYKAAGSLATFTKAAIGCGYHQLGLEQYTTTTKNIASYVLTLVEATSKTTRSKPKTFTVDRTHEAYTRYILYADGAGNFKTFHAWGKSGLSADLTFDVAMLQPDPVTLPQQGAVLNTNIRAVLNDQVNSGYLDDPATYDQIMELLVSPKVYRAMGTSLVPITITSKKFTYSADGVNLLGCTIEYRLAWDEQTHTADSAALHIPQLNSPQQSINDI